jgi:hypothetical protein
VLFAKCSPSLNSPIRYYVNTYTGVSLWEFPTQPAEYTASPPPALEQQTQHLPYTPLPTPGSEVSPGAAHPDFTNTEAPTPGAEYPGPAGASGFPGPAEGQSNGERGFFRRSRSSSPNGHKHGLIGKLVMGAGAATLLGGAVQELGKHFGVAQQQNNPPPPPPQEHHHWWQQAAVMPNFGPSPPVQQQNQPSQNTFFSSAFPSVGGFGSGGITGPGACPNAPGETHEHQRSWTYNLTFNQAPQTSVQQCSWHMCRKCLVLNWVGKGVGPCAAGGRHDNSGSRDYRLDAGPNGQKNWRFCNKCCSLGFNGQDDLGKCPGGGVHDHLGSWDFGVLHDGEAGNEDRWKWCNKCMQLCFDGYH